MDTRLTELLPAALGIKNGDVKMIKNAGGIISHPFGSVIRLSLIHIWRKLVRIISDNYNQYTGFVILHGTDTMAYTASALSFMLEGLNKPVILTGSQLPIGVLRTDGKENLLTSIEIATARHPNGRPIVPEVFFESFSNITSLYRNSKNSSVFHFIQ